MAEESNRRERDMILAPNEYLYVSDETKGIIDVFVGPTKQSLSGTDQPVIFDESTKRFKRVELKEAIQTVKTAPEGWYIVLKNPAKDGKRPSIPGKASTSELEIGRKVNTPGPVSFALWPGQMAKVLKGHHIRSNQYLLVRVYDEEAATKNWKNAIIKTQVQKDPGTEATQDPDYTLTSESPPDLTMGKLLVIKGTEVSFYIPPTGVEVVADENGNLVREAVTLGRLEYCLLYDENGNKRYERGPQVVFPRPTEVFATREISDGKAGGTNKTRKHKAIELNENSGIYVKVIADYEEDGQQHKVGDELFITGRQQMIYFPREEHAIVKYDNSDVFYGIAIPAGEARYVLDRNSGDIKLVRGPTVFLPDPRKEVITRRILDLKICDMLYPGNTEAMAYNAQLAGVNLSSYLSEAIGSPAAVAVAAAATAPIRGMDISSNAMYSAGLVGDDAMLRGLGNKPAKGFSGDQFERKTQYTPPRTITLQTKWDGAVTVEVWTGYAMMLVRKSGEKRVVVGPQTVLLEYDESPQVLMLSRGKPKTTDNLLRTAFLLTRANKVSDVVKVETSDFCKLDVKVSYRVNFEGDSESWFGVENYVKFLCDHMRSKLRNAIKKIGVEEFYAKSDDIIRDVVLGKTVDPSNGKVTRTGTKFEENGMNIYDIEVLDVALEDKNLAQLLTNAQREVINHTLSLAKEKRILEFTRESETIKQRTAEVRTETVVKQHELALEELKSSLASDLAKLDAQNQTDGEKCKLSMAMEQARAQEAQIKLHTVRAAEEQTIELEAAKLAQRVAWLQAEIQGHVERAKAVSPDLIAALNSFGERELIERVAKSMAPMALLGGDSVLEVLRKMVEGSPLAKHLLPAATNGTTQPHA